MPAQGNSATSGHQQAVSKLGLGTEWRRRPVSSFPRKRESRGGGGVLQRRFPAPPRLWIPAPDRGRGQAFAGMTIWGVCASLGWRFDTACQVLFRLGLVQSISYGNGCEDGNRERRGQGEQIVVTGHQCIGLAHQRQLKERELYTKLHKEV